MNAIRRDEELDNLHSVYVDQWDWEKVIAPRDRNVQYLKDTVRDHCGAPSARHQSALRCAIAFPALHLHAGPATCHFITTQELEDRCPDLTPNEREDAWVQEHPTAFLMQIGEHPQVRQAPRRPRPRLRRLGPQRRHPACGTRVLERAFELSSMGIRVDAAALDRQLTAAGCDQRRDLPFHKMLLNGRAAPDHRRRHWPVPAVHVADRHLPYWRGSGEPVGC